MERGTSARLAALSAIGGFVDAVSFVMLFGLFTTHLSGDTTHLASDVGAGIGSADAIARIVIIVVFVSTVATGSIIMAIVRSAAVARRNLMATEAVLLVALMLAGAAWLDHAGWHAGALRVTVLAACAAGAMGLQTAVVRDVVGPAVTTTYVTGMLAAFAEDLVAWVRDRSDTQARARAVRHVGMWSAFLAGGIGGAASASAWNLWALAVPLGALAVLIVLDARAPAAQTS